MLDKIFPQSSELLKLMGEALLVVDADGVIRSATPPADELFATEPGALIGTHFGVPVTSGEYSELDVISKTGDIRIVQMRAINAECEGEPVHILTLRDVTAQKRLEEELQNARAGAGAADRAKSNFLDNMTHEIRTPMIGILGMTELTLATNLSHKQREYLEMVRHSAGSLLEILNDILDYAKIETGNLELADQPFDLSTTVEDAIRVFMPLAEKKGIKLSWFISKDAPAALLGDAGRIRQILVNLVGNSVKFTDMGMVRVEVTPDRKEQNEEGTVRLLFSVQDTGIGIPQDKLGAIFDSFTQADGSTSRRYQGAGLGLSIFKHLVDMMGGEVGVRSEEGRGSAFTFTLPLKVAPTTQAADNEAPAEASLPPLTILLAEDNPVNQIFISELLEQQGHRVIKAHTGRQAVKALKENEVDVVLMDIQMPEMDGIEATRIIRGGNGHFKQDIPIIALTAHALKGDRERFLDAGMNDYLPKPVGLEELQASLARVLGRQEAPAPQEPPAPPQASDEDLEVLDYPWLLEKARGNAEFLLRLFAAFVTDQPKTLAAIEAAMTAGDMERLGFLAHSLKGASATMGARKLRAACLALEQSGKAGRAEGLPEQLAALKENMEQVVDVMKSHLESQGEAPALERQAAPAMAR